MAQEPRLGALPAMMPYGNMVYDTCMPDVCTKDELQVRWGSGVVTLG